MQLNTQPKPVNFTHEGAPAKNLSTEEQLRRSVMACMLWEDTFYESGESITDRIKKLIPEVRTEFAAACAYHARTDMKLRHVPLFIVREMARCDRHKHVVAKLLADVIQRPDELTEFLAIYWKDHGGKRKEPLSNQVRKGLARAFLKFNEYELAKYNREKEIKLCDVMALVHPKPQDEEQEALFKRVASGTLKTPDTWEVALSSGADKKETFLRLMAEHKLGALAFLRNLRNMHQAGISVDQIANYATWINVERVLPFRFIAAARAVPAFEHAIEPLMLKCMQAFDKLPGKTAILVDMSGSMHRRVSDKSELDRADAASALAALVREVCEDSVVIAFGTDAAVVPSRRGFALIDAIKRSAFGGTNTDKALYIAAKEGYDRLILVTDEQSHTRYPDPKTNKAYCINVATYKNGIGYGPKWTHIDGWSESVLNYIMEREATEG